MDHDLMGMTLAHDVRFQLPLHEIALTCFRYYFKIINIKISQLIYNDNII